MGMCDEDIDRAGEFWHLRKGKFDIYEKNWLAFWISLCVLDLQLILDYTIVWAEESNLLAV